MRTVYMITGFVFGLASVYGLMSGLLKPVEVGVFLWLFLAVVKGDSIWRREPHTPAWLVMVRALLLIF